MVSASKYTSTFFWKIVKTPRPVNENTDGNNFDVEIIEEINISFSPAIFGPSETIISEHTLIHFPILTFTTRSKTDNTGKYDATYFKSSNRIDTPLGTFDDCIVKEETVSDSDGAWKIFSFFAPGIGLVKHIFWILV